jgi:hypothetical protein
VVHTNGIHLINLSFCECPGAAEKDIQLLCASWFPATLTRPCTAFTFDLLDSFHLLTLQSKTSAFDYYMSLEHKTDNTGVDGMHVCYYFFLVGSLSLTFIQHRYEQFLLIMRIWRHLMLLKRAGRGHDPKGVSATACGECAVECPACPHPDRNLPDGWEQYPNHIKCDHPSIVWIVLTVYLQVALPSPPHD